MTCVLLLGTDLSQTSMSEECNTEDTGTIGNYCTKQDGRVSCDICVVHNVGLKFKPHMNTPSSTVSR